MSYREADVTSLNTGIIRAKHTTLYL